MATQPFRQDHPLFLQQSSTAPRVARRKGFTLIELLIVVVIIGILAAVAVPKFQNTKGKSFAASLKSDLRNVATAQEAYAYELTVYASNISQLNHTPSRGVTITITAGGDPRGWSATATHQQAFPLTCAIFIGSVAPQAPAVTEGVIGCTN